MSKQFFCRVELHGASDYAALWEVMKSMGWEKTISANGKDFKLPTGMYQGSTNGSATHITLRDAISEAIAATKLSPSKAAWVLVVECAGANWALQSEVA